MILPAHSVQGAVPSIAPVVPAFAALSASGPDPRRDGVFRIGATIVDVRGGVTRVDRLTDPAADAPERREAMFARVERRFGIPRVAFTGAPGARAAWEELGEELVARPLLVPERAPFELWAERLAPQREVPLVLGLDELGALLLPGAGGAGAVAGGRLATLAADELPGAALAIVRALHRVGVEGAGALRVALESAHRALVSEAPAAARRLAFALALVDRPSLLAAASGESAGDVPGDGWWSAAGRAVGDAEVALDRLAPRAAEVESGFFESASLPPDAPWVAPLSDDDLARIDEAFASGVVTAGGLVPRPAQAQVAREVAQSLGRRELLLLHAPTGTGKTLAYLVPLLLFATRNSLRVGVATYTRALQTQALRRDVPLALALLGRVDPALAAAPPRVAALKGRTAYLCWRAFVAAWPERSEAAANLLAAAHLLAFALSSADGDLDELVRPAFGAEDVAVETALDRTLREVRADARCCTSGDDRATCAAESARRRAERSHVVVTNQALVLARQEFLRHVVFDECEHLHDQAHAAFSHRFAFHATRQELARLAGGRGPLERAAAEAGPGTCPALDEARGLVQDAAEGLAGLEEAAAEFVEWRASRVEGDASTHTMCARYLSGDEGRGLLAAHGRAARSLRALVATLARVPAEVGVHAARMRRSLRRLDRARADLEEHVDALTAWLPTSEGRPALRAETFYDIEEQGARLALVARVLLPAEVLGRHFFPNLAGAVFLSATTWLRGDFALARGYLGLDRAAEPAPDETREPSAVRAVRAPESFDYGRVLVAVPKDTPSYRDSRERWLAHVARFVGHLATRTDGRVLVLFTAAEDLLGVARALDAPCRDAGLELLWQGMPGETKERLADRFRTATAAVLLGLDTFWFGADFPGEALEYVVIAKLPYGVPDRYHHAQAAALGSSEQRRRIYLPRALARFRQGFGRLMRRASDRGCVFVLDARANEPRHRTFLAELPIGEGGARLATGPTDSCLREAFRHMGLEEAGPRFEVEWS